MGTQDDVVATLLDRYGETYAAEAGITLADKPSPLYELLVLTLLLSHRISAEVAVAAARELFGAGYRTPARMRAASWQDRVDALGRGHFRRYDESTATRLGESADLLIERWDGDLRKLRDESDGDPGRIHEALTAFDGIGPVGADIFLREVQGVWPSVAPYVDGRVAKGADLVGLPSDPAALAALVPASDLPRLVAALVRVALHPAAAKDLERKHS